jgi:hypothetical protein
MAAAERADRASCCGGKPLRALYRPFTIDIHIAGSRPHLGHPTALNKAALLSPELRRPELARVIAVTVHSNKPVMSAHAHPNAVRSIIRACPGGAVSGSVGRRRFVTRFRNMAAG